MCTNLFRCGGDESHADQTVRVPRHHLCHLVIRDPASLNMKGERETPLAHVHALIPGSENLCIKKCFVSSARTIENGALPIQSPSGLLVLANHMQQFRSHRTLDSDCDFPHTSSALVSSACSPGSHSSHGNGTKQWTSMPCSSMYLERSAGCETPGREAEDLIGYLHT